MIQKEKILSKIPGPKSIELRQREDQMLANGLQGFATMSGIVVESGSGSIIRDIDGNEFLDIIGGIGVNGLGHSHPKIIKAIQKQITEISVGSFSTLARLELLEEIQKVKLANLGRLQLYSSGAAAVESALRLAKNKTGKHEFAAFSGGFHGKTQGALALLGSDFKKSYGPFAPGHHTIPYANCSSCPLKLKHPSCSLACVEMGRHQLKNNITSGLAAIIIEPMQGTAGNIIPPKDFLPAIKEVAKEFDALLIADEMITGFGRTGKFWGCDHSGVTPDIMTIGKQFGGGVPISGILTTDEISQTRPWGDPSGSSSSYGGNPLASRAAATSLQIIQEEKLVENSKTVGNYFLNELKSFEEKYSFVSNVRGEGLFLGLDLVESKESNQLISKEKSYMIFNKFLQKGLLTMSYAPKFRIQPAMTINENTVDNIVRIMDDVFMDLNKKGYNYPN